MKKEISTKWGAFLILLTYGMAFILSSNALAKTPAFPGAVGFGSTTPGGRGGRIIAVTNLNSSGTGSFRAACEADGARIVVFKTGGTIHISSVIKIRNPYITIAGQTAPGGGICVRGAGLSIATHDVIVRGLRIRVGDGTGGPQPDNRDGLLMESNLPTYNVVVDHCSISWAVDESLSIWNSDAHDITISNSIISEALHNSLHSKGPHSMGAIVGPGSSRITFFGNLMAHNNARNPRLKGTQIEIINNVVYDRGNKDVDIGGGSGPQEISIVGNFFQKGPSFTSTNTPVYFREDVPAGSKVYVNDNIFNSYTSASIYNSNNYIVTSQLSWVSNISAKEGGAVFDWVLSHVGANPANPDPVDARIVNQAKNRSGRIIDSPSQVGGWPILAEGTPPADADHDGMPDFWERTRDLDPDNADDADSDRDDDGYTNIEEYINSLLWVDG